MKLAGLLLICVYAMLTIAVLARHLEFNDGGLGQRNYREGKHLVV